MEQVPSLKGIKDYLDKIKKYIDRLFGWCATPEAYGAVGDGVTDDTAAIKAAVSSGKPVHLTQKYAITDTINVQSEIVLASDCIVYINSNAPAFTIQGMGRSISGKGTIRIGIDGYTESAIKVLAESRRCTIADVFIRGYSSNSYGEYGTGIEFATADAERGMVAFCTIRDVQTWYLNRGIVFNSGIARADNAAWLNNCKVSADVSYCTYGMTLIGVGDNGGHEISIWGQCGNRYQHGELIADDGCALQEVGTSVECNHYDIRIYDTGVVWEAGVSEANKELYRLHGSGSSLRVMNDYDITASKHRGDNTRLDGYPEHFVSDEESALFGIGNLASCTAFGNATRVQNGLFSLHRATDNKVLRYNASDSNSGIHITIPVSTIVANMSLRVTDITVGWGAPKPDRAELTLWSGDYSETVDLPIGGGNRPRTYNIDTLFTWRAYLTVSKIEMKVYGQVGSGNNVDIKCFNVRDAWGNRIIDRVDGLTQFTEKQYDDMAHYLSVNGEAGPAGANGYTPVRGTDYWTAADQQAIVAATLAALPVYAGEVV